MNLPGSKFHQALLRHLMGIFEDDRNILMFGVFGSLARGDWDQYSDLDLDVILADDGERRVNELVQRVSGALEQSPFSLLLAFEERLGNWVFITRELERLSIRFHERAETSPNILDTLLVVSGPLTVEDLAHVAGDVPGSAASLRLKHDKFLEQSIYVPIYLHRDQLLAALRVMQTLRDLIVSMYDEVHGIPKDEKFDKQADADLVEALLSTYSTADHAAIHDAWQKLVWLYHSQIRVWTEGRIELSPHEQELLDHVLRF